MVLAERFALLIAAFVAPELDPGGGYIALVVNADGAVHLSAGGDGGNRIGADRGFGEDLLNCAAGILPPGIGLLLRPVCLRAVDLVFYPADADDLAVWSKHGGPDALGADIQC